MQRCEADAEQPPDKGRKHIMLKSTGPKLCKQPCEFVQTPRKESRESGNSPRGLQQSCKRFRCSRCSLPDDLREGEQCWNARSALNRTMDAAPGMAGAASMVELATEPQEVKWSPNLEVNSLPCAYSWVCRLPVFVESTAVQYCTVRTSKYCTVLLALAVGQVPWDLYIDRIEPHTQASL